MLLITFDSDMNKLILTQNQRAERFEKTIVDNRITML